MKAIAIVELPDDAFDKGRWYLDKIYYTEKESLFDNYANEMWEVKPLPEECDDAIEIYNAHGEVDCYQLTDYARGYNACLEDIIGKEEDCRDCQEWESCSCGKMGHDKGTSIGYSIGECKCYKEK